MAEFFPPFEEEFLKAPQDVPLFPLSHVIVRLSEDLIVQRKKKLLEEIPNQILENLPNQILPLGNLCDLLAAALALPPLDKQMVMEETDVIRRAEILLFALKFELGS